MEKLSENIIKVLLVILVLGFVSVCLIKRFVYFKPSSNFVNTQESYKVINHGNLHGWMLENPESDKIVLFCHGNSGNISYCESKLKSLRNLGYNVMIFDYSGYGKSSGVPSEIQMYKDTSYIVSLLRQRYTPNQIILYGFSMGGPVATYVAIRYSIPVLILEAPLPGIKPLIKHRYPYLSFLSIFFNEFDTASYLRQYKGRSLILHSPTDEVIPFDSIQEILSMCSKFIQIDGSHNMPIIPWEQIKNFIDNGN
jgi:fermentation-respiration switch protein FrsA (DUF1100 family)